MRAQRLILPWEEARERRTRVREGVVLVVLGIVLVWQVATCATARGVVRAPRAPVTSSGR